MSPDEMHSRQITHMRFLALFARAWRDMVFAHGYDRGPVFDKALGTSSHGTIALQSYLRAKGL